MKIIISEHQLRSIILESYDQDRVDYLLDKINAMGINSLTDKEKETLNNLSQGKDDEYADDPFDRPISPEYVDRSDHESDIKEPANLLGMFMYFAPEVEEIKVNDQIWHVEIIDDNNEQHLHVANETNDFYVTPFWGGENVITIETNDGKNKKYKINNIPSNEKEMKSFIGSFYRHILPKIINTVS